MASERDRDARPRRPLTVEDLERMTDAELERELGIDALDDEEALAADLFGDLDEDQRPARSGPVRVEQAGPGSREEPDKPS